MKQHIHSQRPARKPKFTFRQYEVNGRIELTPSENIPGGWTIIDNLDSYLVDFETKTEALAAARFAREYIRQHGDINFGSFPFSWDDPLPDTKLHNYARYWDDDQLAKRPWMSVED